MKPKIFKKEGNIVFSADIGKRDECTLIYVYKIDKNGRHNLFDQYAIYPTNKENINKISQIKKMIMEQRIIIK